MLYEEGDKYDKEDVVCHAWGEIVGVYFPKAAATPYGERWSVEREAYRGLNALNIPQIKPDITVIRLTQPQIRKGQRPQVESRDYLWIECKAAFLDTPSGWRAVLQQAARRLVVAHPSREVKLLVAVGFKCMFFDWRPSAMMEPLLFVRPALGSGKWEVDVRLRPVLDSRWIDSNTGEILTRDALELDSWSLQTAYGQEVLANWKALRVIEKILLGLQDSALEGTNAMVW